MIRTPSRLTLLGIIVFVGACSRGESAGAPDGSTELERAAASKAAPAPASYTLAGGTRVEAAINDVETARLALRWSLDQADAADALLAAVKAALDGGARTRDLGGSLSTVEMGDAVLARL